MMFNTAIAPSKLPFRPRSPLPRPRYCQQLEIFFFGFSCRLQYGTTLPDPIPICRFGLNDDRRRHAPVSPAPIATIDPETRGSKHTDRNSRRPQPPIEKLRHGPHRRLLGNPSSWQYGNSRSPECRIKASKSNGAAATAAVWQYYSVRESPFS